MIEPRRASERGLTQTNWLDSRHTFSFNRYYDPRFVGFRDLLVINEDVVAPAMGFGTHSHSDMEIISYVLEGTLQHRDSLGNSSVIRPGEFQRMSAGTGVRHSEFNPSPAERTHFLQIWITPEQNGMKPSYEQRMFSPEERRGKLRLVASREGSDGSVTVHQDVKLFNALLDAGDEIEYRLAIDRYAWAQVLRGSVTLNDVLLGQGDGAAVSQEEILRLRSDQAAEILLFDLA
jgi:quercetin 2,3-dioxygenase